VRNGSPVEPVISVIKREKIPSHWDLVPIGDICASVDKVNPKDNPADGFKYIDISGIDNERFMVAETKAYYGNNAPSRARQLVREGDIVFSTVRTYLKNMARITRELDGEVASTGFCVLRPKDPEYSDYLYYYLQYEPFLNELAKFQRGTSYPAVRDGDIFAQFIPVPPKHDAVRIVAEIEKQFSRLDEAVANLKRVKANLKRYKAAVLKAAVEGKLTEEWRKSHSEVEPTSELLKRILVERKKKWEETALAKMKEKEKQPKDDKWKRNYSEPTPLTDAVPLSILPKTWAWVTVDQVGFIGEQSVLTGPFGSNMGKGDFQIHGVPVLTIGCLKEEGIFLGSAAYITERKAKELDRYRLKEGDLLFSRMAAVGRAGFVTKYFSGAIFNYHIMRLRLSTAAIDPHYFISYVRGAKTVVDYVREVNHGATRDGINTDQLLAMPVALPPLIEQRKIMQEVDSKISLANEIEKDVNANLNRAERMRQSLLRQAFSGQLGSNLQED
jgi:type I restriction enzyme S subunit